MTHALSFVSMGWRQGVPPPKALHIAATWRGNPSFVMVALTVAVAIAIAISVAIADSIAVANSIAAAIAIAITVVVAVAIAHCRYCCSQPLPLRLPSTIAAAISVAPPSAIVVTIALAISHCRCCHRWPLQLPLPSAITVPMLLAISESCCLGMARIVFNQLKQQMLTLFLFVCKVGGALIKAGWLTRCRAATANTSVGRWAASSEQLVREVAFSLLGKNELRLKFVAHSHVVTWETKRKTSTKTKHSINTLRVITSLHSKWAFTLVRLSYVESKNCKFHGSQKFQCRPKTRGVAGG